MTIPFYAAKTPSAIGLRKKSFRTDELENSTSSRFQKWDAWEDSGKNTEIE